MVNRLHLLRASLWLVPLATAAAACAIERPFEAEGGIHPPGFASQGDAQFHGDHLREGGYEMAECRLCHGDDYGGGPVGVSCSSSGCHTDGVEWCGTCHDGKAPPSPVTGAHPTHPGGCADCHRVPEDAREINHPNGEVEVLLGGLAESGDHSPLWSPDQDRCQNTYCHGAESPPWSAPVSLECDACHGAPPGGHERFSVAAAPEGCAPCHPVPGDARHLDGAKDYLEPGCAQCHGTGPRGAPPPALDGGASPASRGVGAHVRHLDETLADRIGRPVACEECHDVPASMFAEGHLDDSAPADVRFVGGDYDPVTGSCVVGCHWDKDPGPVWTDTDPAITACDGCHAFPPLVTLVGTPHPAVEPSQETCLLCHQFAVSTHVDGHVDMLP